MDSTEPDDALPDAPDALRERVRVLEAEIKRRDKADETSRTRKDKAVTFAGEVAVGAVAGSDVKRRGRDFWDAWRAFGAGPRTESFPEEATREFAVSVLARLTRVRLVLVLAAAIPSLFILAQTVLLSQQNARFDRQNNLLAFEQTAAIRDLLFTPPYNSTGQTFRDYHAIPDSLLYADSLYKWAQPNTSTVEQIEAFVLTEPQIAIEALRPLVFDDAPPVAIGALQALTTSIPPLRSSSVKDSLSATEGRFQGAYLADTDLRSVSFDDADLRDADLSWAYLQQGVLSYADLRNATLLEARLDSATLIWADLGGADLTGAILDRANLSHADLSGATAVGAQFPGANLMAANLNGTDVMDANFASANLSGADIGGRNLPGAQLEGANVYCVRNAPPGFEVAARRRGAISQRTPQLGPILNDCSSKAVWQ